MAFFGAFNSPRMKFMPTLEDTLGKYLQMLLAMVIVFQMPTVVFFLAKVGLVTAGFLWRNVKYAILAIFVAAAVMTSSADAWNQVVPAPMIALYLLSIGIAWLVQPRSKSDAEDGSGAEHLRLVVVATMFDQARRQSRPRVAARAHTGGRPGRIVDGRW